MLFRSYLFISALLTFFIVSMKNAGVAIVMYFVVSFVMMIVGGVTQVVAMLSDPASSSYAVLEFVNNANMFTSTLIGNGSSYQWKEVLAILLPSILLTGVLLFFGLRIFRKKDLK